MNETKKKTEVMEALTAANLALDSLERAKQELGGARGWGIWDMVGGGIFSTLFKHSRMDQAKAAMDEAKGHLMTLKRELVDVQISENFELEVGDFLSFADYFFDGIVADLMVQSKIKDAAIQVDDAIANVQNICVALYNMMEEDQESLTKGGIE